ncbi:MAG: hypothetical protein QOE92_2490 [Chloroflexota bacterium]|jgi:acyl-CoA synthetase (AMP-forming)/AMP-acid ligase II|nr:hypothetical protein [Chloroflexota bacterium]
MIHASPYPDLDIPDSALTPFIFHHGARLDDKPAIIDVLNGRSLTYAEVLDGANRLAAGLAERGFGKGQVLAILAPNVPEYPAAFHGVALTGGAITTLNPTYTAEEIAFQLKDSGARFLVTIPDLVDKAREAADASGVVEDVLAIGGGPGVAAFDTLMSDGPVPEIAINPAEDVVALPYSSGTTGFSKGVMLTHRNLVANVLQIENGQHISEDEGIIAFLPFFHIYGMQVLMNHALHKGATILSMPRFDLEPFLRTAQDHRVKRLFLVPPVVIALAKHPMVDQFDLSSVEIAFSGAAPLDAETAETAARRVGCKVMQGYGLTETGPVTHLVPDTVDVVQPGSIGPSVPNTEVKVVDPDTGTELGVGDDGEIWIRGPQVMKGYLNNDEATRGCIDDDGFFHSGDIGHVDEQGEFHIVDRLKELIKVKGFQVAPAELEAVLITHPSIADAAVIGIPDAESGEVPKAFVVFKEPMEEAAVKAYVAEKVAHYKQLRAVEVLDEIPKSASGKILRRLLRDREKATAAT